MRPVAGKYLEHLAYLDDYIDTIEALPLELQRNFTLMRELDGYAQELMDSVASQAISLIDNIKEMNAADRAAKFRDLITLLTESLKRGEEKVALAKSTHDAVDRHCNRLDADLVKLEEVHPIGAVRITTIPGLEPTSRSLREGMEFREKYIRRLDKDRKEMKMDKKPKKRRLKEDQVGRPPKDPKIPKVQQARSNGPGKSKKATSNDAIDPEEPLYCYCQQVSYGEMVACDNVDCEIEWFHLACVDLKTVPKGKWYCDNCQGKAAAAKGKNRRS
ncbi:hypothetical protein BC940DRAFT_307070 [Gongronella butleri]|nr:hypothetical protein BC940DRAFT_307070 [Gongronella butleri]